MKISLNWLKKTVPYEGSVDELAELLTQAGLGVESVETRGVDFPKVVVAQILESNPHPNADRLSVCRVDDGSGEPRQIVCGAKNYRVGDKVPLALPGAVLPGDFKIKIGKLRGVESEGMLCSAKELKLAEDAEGLLILPADAPVGEPVSRLYPADTIFDLEITSNRPDWLSHAGVAREVAAFRGLEFRLPECPSVSVREDASVARIENPEACPFYSARRIRGVKVGASPEWLRLALEAVGLRPINNVVDVTNYVMLELGQPLHAFDLAKLSGGIVVRNAAAGESIVALDEKTYVLKEHHLVIAESGTGVPPVDQNDQGQDAPATSPLAIAGVMGGRESGVGEGTTDLLLESALFDAPAIRRAARELDLQSDSSYRFERGVDPGAVLAASARAAALIVELAGGEADAETVTAGALPELEWTVPLRNDRCRALLGSEISDAEIEEALTALGLRKTAGDSGTDRWTIPSFRGDLRREADLIEEVVRMTGIDRIPGRLTGEAVPSSAADLAYDDAMRLRGVLSGAGFSEARTSTLVSRTSGPAERKCLEIRNPLGGDQSVLRPTLIDGLLAATERNLHFGAESVRLYEIGRLFADSDEEETLYLGIVMTGAMRAPSWKQGEPDLLDFFDLKGVLEMLAPRAVFEKTQDARFGLALGLRVDGAPAGIAGQLSPAKARALHARGPVVAAEIRLSALASADAKRVCAPIAKYPSVTRDIAAVTPRELPYGEIRRVIQEAGEPLLEEIRPFDIFTDDAGEKLASDRKSLAFSLTFRSPERTLTADEVTAACDRLKGLLREQLPVEIRE